MEDGTYGQIISAQLVIFGAAVVVLYSTGTYDVCGNKSFRYIDPQYVVCFAIALKQDCEFLYTSFKSENK